MVQGRLAALQSRGTQAPFFLHPLPSMDHVMVHADWLGHRVSIIGKVFV